MLCKSVLREGPGPSRASCRAAAQSGPGPESCSVWCSCTVMLTADWSRRGNAPYFINITSRREEGKRRERTRVKFSLVWLYLLITNQRNRHKLYLQVLRFVFYQSSQAFRWSSPPSPEHHLATGSHKPEVAWLFFFYTWWQTHITNTSSV